MPETIYNLLEQKNYAALKELFSNMNIVDIAQLLNEIDEKETVLLFRMLKKDTAADVFAYLDSDMRKHIIETISDKDVRDIIDDMFLDDVVDLVEEMPANMVKRVLKNVSHEKRDQINQLLQYPEDSVGSIMTVEFVNLRETETVEQAFSHIRKTGVDKETIYSLYVISADRMLLGVVSAKTLMLSAPDDLIGNIMDKNVIYAYTTDDQEKIANEFNKYGLLAMPVVDKEKRLVGIVTVDDVVQVIQEENTEDFEIMAALSPSDEPYLKTNVLKLSKNRIVWLLILMLSATITGFIITLFESALSVVPALIASIPMLMNTGGNAGSQASTLIIRGMALDEIKCGDILIILWKELRVSIICGLVLAAVNFIRISITQSGDVKLALTVSLSLLCTVIMAKSVGCMLPIIAKKLRADPAIMAAPLITTIVDAGSLIMYFMIASVILHV